MSERIAGRHARSYLRSAGGIRAQSRVGPKPPTLTIMLLAVIWHWWIGFFLTIGSILLVMKLVVGYFVKVENPRYPKKP